MKYLLIFLSFFLFSCSFSWDKNIEVKKENNIVPEKEMILALWDSLTAWYWVWTDENYPYKLQKTLDENWYNYEVINAWVSWDTSANVLSRASLYLEKNPSIVLLVVWWNDWLRWLSTSDLKSNILKIIDTFPNSKIVLAWMDIPANLWIKYRQDFKNVYTEIAKERSDVYFMEFFLDWVAWNASLNIDDMIHPNSAWYDIIVKNLFEFLEGKGIVE
jgi:acyl-CoA thioesterase-1